MSKLTIPDTIEKKPVDLSISSVVIIIGIKYQGTAGKSPHIARVHSGG
jgi:hypothetical protein